MKGQRSVCLYLERTNTGWFRLCLGMNPKDWGWTGGSVHTSVCLYSSDAALAHREAVSWEIHRAVVLLDKAADNYCVKICRMTSRTFCSPRGWEGKWQNPKPGGDLDQTSGRTVVALC